MSACTRRIAAILTVVGVLGISGCSAGNVGGDADAESNDSAREQGDLVKSRPKAMGLEPAATDLANFDCGKAKRGDVWAASGNITSSAKGRMIYKVTVVTVEGSNDVLGERIQRFTLKPDETVSFEFPNFYTGEADACMPRLERRPA
ncbi:MAG: hypothetical protein GEU93_14080 [Propionibacteriales bacterium]|nr:hypothetical protein [Propionibacteriales bacterium]